MIEPKLGDLAPNRQVTLSVAYLSLTSLVGGCMNTALDTLRANEAFRATVQGLSVDEALALRQELHKVHKPAIYKLVDVIRLQRFMAKTGHTADELRTLLFQSTDLIPAFCAESDKGETNTLFLIEHEAVLGLGAMCPVAVTENSGALRQVDPGNYRQAVFDQGISRPIALVAANYADDYGYPLAPWVIQFRKDVEEGIERLTPPSQLN